MQQKIRERAVIIGGGEHRGSVATKPAALEQEQGPHERKNENSGAVGGRPRDGREGGGGRWAR